MLSLCAAPRGHGRRSYRGRRRGSQQLERQGPARRVSEQQIIAREAVGPLQEDQRRPHVVYVIWVSRPAVLGGGRRRRVLRELRMGAEPVVD